MSLQKPRMSRVTCNGSVVIVVGRFIICPCVVNNFYVHRYSARVPASTAVPNWLTDWLPLPEWFRGFGMCCWGRESQRRIKFKFAMTSRTQCNTCGVVHFVRSLSLMHWLPATIPIYVCRCRPGQYCLWYACIAPLHECLQIANVGIFTLTNLGPSWINSTGQ